MIRRLLNRIGGLAGSLVARVLYSKRPSMIGPPPSARKQFAIPPDPAGHAIEFAIEYADRLEQYVEGRMHALGIPEERMGHSDRSHDVLWRVLPHETTGGGVVGPRIGVDSGVLNPDLLTKPYGAAASQVWARSRLRDRIDAIIAHEFAEAAAASHRDAIEQAVDTPLNISEAARHILHAMAQSERDG
jgi:hypothetical protein